jgi:transglutaminase-like putative cysteine protease
MHLSTVEAVLEYQVREPAHFCFHLEAAQGPHQVVVSEQLQVAPELPLRRFQDPRTGNRFLRFDAPIGRLALHYRADVELHLPPLPAVLREVPVTEVPDAVLPYLLPTRYCQSDLLGGFAREQFGALPRGLGRVQAISEWIRRQIEYRPGSTRSTTTAQEVLAQRAGVCRDFAHLGITFCQALNIPARFVSGYVWFDEPPQDFHAAFEAWLGGQWVLFDPTGMAPVDRLVRIGTGRDAKDVAFSTSFGGVALARKVVSVLEHDPRVPTANAAAAPQPAAVPSATARGRARTGRPARTSTPSTAPRAAPTGSSPARTAR